MMMSSPSLAELSLLLLLLVPLVVEVVLRVVSLSLSLSLLSVIEAMALPSVPLPLALLRLTALEAVVPCVESAELEREVCADAHAVATAAQPGAELIGRECTSGWLRSSAQGAVVVEEEEGEVVVACSVTAAA